jgi:hypothetical protein
MSDYRRVALENENGKFASRNAYLVINGKYYKLKNGDLFVINKEDGSVIVYRDRNAKQDEDVIVPPRPVDD